VKGAQRITLEKSLGETHAQGVETPAWRWTER
jgi:hypothetical protein